MITTGYIGLGILGTFFITKLLYFVLRFNVKSDHIFMVCLTVIHLLCGVILYPIYPLLHFQFWKF